MANAFEHEMSKSQFDGQLSPIDREYLAAINAEDKLELWRAEAAKVSSASGGA